MINQVITFVGFYLLETELYSIQCPNVSKCQSPSVINEKKVPSLSADILSYLDFEKKNPFKYCRSGMFNSSLSIAYLATPYYHAKLKQLLKFHWNPSGLTQESGSGEIKFQILPNDNKLTAYVAASKYWNCIV